MKKKLTSKLINSLTPRDKPYEVRDTDVSGLLLRVQPTGGMSYFYSYKSVSGKKQRIRIGDTSLTPVQARDVARGYAGVVAKGGDPQKEKKELAFDEKSSKQVRDSTVGGFVCGEYEKWVVSENKTGADTIRRLRSNFGHLYSKSMDDLCTWDIDTWKVKQKKTG